MEVQHMLPIKSKRCKGLAGRARSWAAKRRRKKICHSENEGEWSRSISVHACQQCSSIHCSFGPHPPSLLVGFLSSTSALTVSRCSPTSWSRPRRVCYLEASGGDVTSHIKMHASRISTPSEDSETFTSVDDYEISSVSDCGMYLEVAHLLILIYRNLTLGSG
ncbi:uncharacterized protein LOC100896535 [Callithrix jacchus]